MKPAGGRVVRGGGGGRGGGEGGGERMGGGQGVEWVPILGRGWWGGGGVR